MNTPALRGGTSLLVHGGIGQYDAVDGVEWNAESPMLLIRRGDTRKAKHHGKKRQLYVGVSTVCRLSEQQWHS